MREDLESQMDAEPTDRSQHPDRQHVLRCNTPARVLDLMFACGAMVDEPDAVFTNYFHRRPARFDTVDAGDNMARIQAAESKAERRRQRNIRNQQVGAK